MTPAGDEIRAQLQGNTSGQIAVGKNIVQTNINGDVVYALASGDRPRVKERPKPVRVRGRRPRDVEGRETEVEEARRAIDAGEPIQFLGPPGIGKSTLLKYIAHGPPSQRVPDGAVYLGAAGRPMEDVLQRLFKAFYETDLPFKPDPMDLCDLFNETRALVLLDDVEAGQHEAELLLDTMPEANFVLAPYDRLDVDARVVRLRGLPDDAALALLERRLERPLGGGERNAALVVCHLLKGHPQQLVRVCGVAREQRTNLEHIGGILAIDDPEAATASLQRRGVVQANSPRYSLHGPPPIKEGDAHDEIAARAGRYFTEWCARHRDDPEVVGRDAPAIVATMRAAGEAGLWEEVVRLGRAAGDGLMLSAQWGSWKQALDLVLQGARAVGDRRHEAWSLHQLGTRVLGLGDQDAAGPLLEAALDLREALGDRDGAAVTRHNLEQMHGPAGGGPPPEPPPEPLPSEPPAGVGIGIGVLLLVLLMIVGIWRLLPDRRPTGGVPTPSNGTTTTTPATSTSTTTPDTTSRPVDTTAASTTATTGTTASGGIALVASPTTLDFGKLLLGRSVAPRTVTVTNVGTIDAQIDSVVPGGLHLRDFPLARGDCSGALLAPERSCEIGVGFAPTEPGARRATVVVTSAGGAGTVVVGVTGIGIAAADLKVELSKAGQVASVVNHGPSPATNVELSIGARNAVVRTGPGARLGCRNVARTGAACSIGNLAPEESVQTTMLVQWREKWQITAEVRGRPDDPDPSNNVDVVEDDGRSKEIPYTDFVLPPVAAPPLQSEVRTGVHCRDPSQKGCERGLPFTGADLVTFAALGVGAIGLGAATLQAARRRARRRRARQA